jgi:hypothetical protein
MLIMSLNYIKNQFFAVVAEVNNNLGGVKLID